MTTTTLIVARADAESLPEIAGIFADSDAGPLPRRLGVQRRSLFFFHGLYFHAIEAGDQLPENLVAARSSDEFMDINAKLSAHVRPYLSNWREPRDAMAQQFYEWTPGGDKAGR